MLSPLAFPLRYAKSGTHFFPWGMHLINDAAIWLWRYYFRASTSRWCSRWRSQTLPPLGKVKNRQRQTIVEYVRLDIIPPGEFCLSGHYSLFSEGHYSLFTGGHYSLWHWFWAWKSLGASQVEPASRMLHFRANF